MSERSEVPDKVAGLGPSSVSTAVGSGVGFSVSAVEGGCSGLLALSMLSSGRGRTKVDACRSAADTL